MFRISNYESVIKNYVGGWKCYILCALEIFVNVVIFTLLRNIGVAVDVSLLRSTFKGVVTLGTHIITYTMGGTY